MDPLNEGMHKSILKMLAASDLELGDEFYSHTFNQGPIHPGLIGVSMLISKNGKSVTLIKKNRINRSNSTGLG